MYARYRAIELFSPVGPDNLKVNSTLLHMCLNNRIIHVAFVNQLIRVSILCYVSINQKAKPGRRERA